MARPNLTLGDLLVELHLLTKEQGDAAEREAKLRKVPLDRVLIDMQLIPAATIAGVQGAHKFGIPFYDLAAHPPSSRTVTLLPEECARSYGIVVVAQDGDKITVATSDPTAPNLLDAITANLGKATMVHVSGPEKKKKKTTKEKYDNIALVFAPKENIVATFSLYRKSLATRFQLMFQKASLDAPEVLARILDEALETRASDIHMEPREEDVIVRFRVDGVMHEAGRMSRTAYQELLNRIKIEAQLRIDEHFSAQDGAIRFKPKAGGSMDVRVSIVPIVDGEKIVMRVLSEYVRNLTLADLGFSEDHRKTLEEAAHKPFGMIITTGPTGAGKSTTLYGLIKMRNQPEVNISTIEDPVEYKIPGINHIQVNQATGLTFAKGLRALLRQDPDVILVGEIRDGETASIAVSAALTGHLVFSTLHSNDSATAIPRMLEMGVEPFLLASTVEVVIAQRLVRRICPRCRFAYELKGAEVQELFREALTYFPKAGKTTFFRGRGCDACSNTGFVGRIGIYELLVVDKVLEELITQRRNSSELLNSARKRGMKLMFDDGIDKVRAGQTTIEELLRVAAPPDTVLTSLH